MPLRTLLANYRTERHGSLRRAGRRPKGACAAVRALRHPGHRRGPVPRPGRCPRPPVIESGGPPIPQDDSGGPPISRAEQPAAAHQGTMTAGGDPPGTMSAGAAAVTGTAVRPRPPPPAAGRQPTPCARAEPPPRGATPASGRFADLAIDDPELVFDDSGSKCMLEGHYRSTIMTSGPRASLCPDYPALADRRSTVRDEHGSDTACPNWPPTSSRIPIPGHTGHENGHLTPKVNRRGPWGGRERGRECYHVPPDPFASPLPGQPGRPAVDSTGLTKYGTESFGSLAPAPSATAMTAAAPAMIIFMIPRSPTPRRVRSR